MPRAFIISEQQFLRVGGGQRDRRRQLVVLLFVFLKKMIVAGSVNFFLSIAFPIKFVPKHVLVYV